MAINKKFPKPRPFKVPVEHKPSKAELILCYGLNFKQIEDRFAPAAFTLHKIDP